MAASTGIISKSYVSALDPMLDTREINRLVTDIYNEDELSDILDLADRKVPTKQAVYYTFVNDPLVKFIDTTGATITGSGGVQISFTAPAAYSGYTRPNDLILFTNGNVGIVYSVTPTSGQDALVIRSVSGANLTCTAGDKISIFSRAVGENSYTPTNLRFGLTKYSNKVQIFRETSKITDIQNAATIEVEIGGQNKYLFKDHWEKKILIKSQRNAAFWAGDMSNTSFPDSNPILVDPVAAADGLSGSGAIQATRGINKSIDLYGTALVNGTLGTYQKANLDNVVQVLLAARAPKEQLVVGGSLAKAAVDTYLKALGSSGVQSVRLVVDGKELDLEVDRLSYGGFKFHYMTSGIQDHPVTLAYTAMPGTLYYLPYNNKVKVEGGGSDAAMRVRFIPKQTVYGDDMTNEVHGGALNPVNPNGYGMNSTTDWVSYQGFEFLGAQHAVKQRVI